MSIRRAALASAIFGLAACARPEARELARGNEAARQGQWDEALTAWKRSTQLAPGNARALLALAQGQRRLGDLTAARQALQQALATEPTNPALHVALGEVEIDDGHPEAAMTAMLGSEDEGRYHLVAARVQLAQGRPAEALQEARRASADPTTLPEAAYLEGCAQLGLARPEDARATFERLRTTAPTSSLGPYGLARLAAREGARAEVLRHLGEARARAGATWRPATVARDPAFAFLGPDPAFLGITTALNHAP